MLLTFLLLFAVAAAVHLYWGEDSPSPAEEATWVTPEPDAPDEPVPATPALPLPEPPELALTEPALGESAPVQTAPTLAAPAQPLPDSEQFKPEQPEPGASSSPGQATPAEAPALPLPIPQPEPPLADKADTPEPAEEAAPAPEPEPQIRSLTRTVRSGDIFPRLVDGYADAAAVQAMLRAARPLAPLTRLRAGQNYTLHLDANGNLEAFVYELDRDHELRVERTGDTFTARREPIAYETRQHLVVGTIRHSLFKSVTDSGESASLASLLVEMFDSEINFIKDVHVNDRFVILVEKRYRDGEFRGYGPVHAARFVNQGKVFEGFRFSSGKNRPDYYNAKGESLRKTLLMAPLAITRITSGYSLNRRHPVYYDNRPHQGVDYGAPKGTPVRAVGSGVIRKAGWGNGFGNMVIMEHGNGLESMYSHLSKFPPNIKPGVQVKQGQTIGFVGSTGVATGPHLDFRLKQNGKYVDPTKVVNPRAASVAASQMKTFTQRVAQLRAALDGRKGH